MNKKRIAICDDERVHLELLAKCVRNCALWKDAQPSVCAFASGHELLSDIHGGSSYAYLFIDIDMPEINGLDVYARISELMEMPVIFISEHMEHQPSVDSFYPALLLSKPFTQEAFDNAIRAYHAREMAIRRFEFFHNGERCSLPCKDIYYFTMAD
ncbi:MAG: response regulator, partial [Oscillospiraceae bacterium]|nr:response regulator [Oscillospiraceae bacterium]